MIPCSSPNDANYIVWWLNGMNKYTLKTWGPTTHYSLTIGMGPRMKNASASTQGLLESKPRLNSQMQRLSPISTGLLN